MPTTPRDRSRRSSAQIPVQHTQQAYTQQSYWNEYDDGSEAGDNAPYTIYVNGYADNGFPGAKAMASLFAGPYEKVKGWLSPTQSPGERQPLLANRNGPADDIERGGYFNDQNETDADDETYASSTDFPTNGYTTHYSTFPSVNDQQNVRHREKHLTYTTIASFFVAFVLLGIASILVATGKHKLLVEVDAGAIVGITTSLFFAALGLGTMLYTTEQLGWLHRSCVGATFVTLCVLNGMLLVLVVSKGL